jgi:ornithine cyclodeaminase/alanine dehydrogenase-like protein (mu-crystallin family)
MLADRWLATARDWVAAAERAYVAAAVTPSEARGAEQAGAGGPRELAELAAVAAAAAGAVASRFLAVGTPRSIGLVGDEAAAALSLAAHRVWFQPADIRWAAVGGGGSPERLVADGAALVGRPTSLDEALAADIVCIHAPLALAAAQLRRGTHVNALAAVELDDELRALATIADEAEGLPALAAGLRDGRPLDELSVFVAGDLAIARGAVGRVGPVPG